MLGQTSGQRQLRQVKALGGDGLTSAFFSTFVSPPCDADWHTDTALPRLALNFYPAALFLIFTRLDLGKREVLRIKLHPRWEERPCLDVILFLFRRGDRSHSVLQWQPAILIDSRPFFNSSVQTAR